MKTLLVTACAGSFLATAAVCAIASERAPASVPTAIVYAGPASIALPIPVLAQAPVTADLKPSLAADAPTGRRPVRVVLASPYLTH